jgi:hypothetical protein
LRLQTTFFLPFALFYGYGTGEIRIPFLGGPRSNQTRTEIGKIIVLEYPNTDATDVVLIEHYRINGASTSLLGTLLGRVFSLCRGVSRVKSWGYARYVKHLITKSKLHMFDCTSGTREIVLGIVL